MARISFGDGTERSIAVVMERRAMTRSQAVCYLLSIGKSCDDERTNGKAVFVGRHTRGIATIGFDLARLDLAGLDAEVKEKIGGG